MLARYRQLLFRMLRVFGGLILIAIVTALDFKVFHVNNSTAAFSYLLVILALATWSGLEESIAASLASIFCYNFFFLPPVGTLTIADPENWVALFAFLVTAITASQLSASARKRADEASARRLEMERLNEFSRALMLGEAGPRVSQQMALQVTEAFGAPSVAFYELASDSVCYAGTSAVESASLEQQLREAAKGGEPWQDENASSWIAPVRLGSLTLGALGISGVRLSAAVVASISQLAAIAMERAREQQVLNRAEATRQNERLKSTVLDALAHEFKTPLTSIKAAVSSVLSQRLHDGVETELLTIIDEEADRLTNLVTDAIRLGRIGAGQVHLRRQPYSPAMLIESVLAGVKGLREDRKIGLHVDDDLPELNADPDLAGLALRQLVGNALKYAPASSPITISAEREGDSIAFHVANGGPGIPAAEHEAIFEKFYRGPAVRDRIPGTGMGLPIARDIIQAHGGRIWLESRPGEGVCFSFTLPVNLEGS